ncbi:hypothetical protein TNCV_4379821 [Trichonephila clavipes]|nr:hypothetical protein TNCV_4379821 [Trichonephila clavipes]
MGAQNPNSLKYDVENLQCSTVVSRKATEKPKVRDIWEISNIEGEKVSNDNHGEEINDFVQSILEFQECDEEDVETWMACDAKD